MGLKYEDIKPVFLSRLERDREATALMSSIESGNATYATATQYAARVGELLGQTLRLNAPITDISDWDIDDLIPGSLGLDHRIVTNACRIVQEALNRDAGIGIRYQEPTFDWNRVHGIVDELRDNPEFINIEETFYDQLTNFSQNVVDSSVRANASIASGAGIKTYVIRTASANACQWCQDAAGQYDYESVKNTGDPVWLRHENCNCTIDYVTERNGSTYRERVYQGSQESAQAAEEYFESGEEREQHRSYTDITNDWSSYIPEGVAEVQEGLFPVDKDGNTIDIEGMITTIDHDLAERSVAALISRNINSEVELIPRINYPQHIKTPDFRIARTGETIELKTLSRYNDQGDLVSPNSFFRRVKTANGQSTFVAVDVSSYPYNDEVLFEQLNRVFNHPNTDFVRQIMVIKDGNIQSVFRRI